MHAISDAQRRARLGVRHALATPVATVEEAVEAVVCLHATEPASVYLAAQARTGLPRASVATALYDERSVVKQLAMRRTLFAFPRALLPAVWGSAGRRVAAQLGARLAKEVVAAGFADDGAAWIDDVVADVLAELASGPATTAELRERIPAMALRLEISPGKSYGGAFPIGPRLLTTLAADGRVLRGVNQGDWRTNRPRWSLSAAWLGAAVEPVSVEEGYAVLVERWLRSFGPGTEADLVWWLGATKSAVRRALADLEAVEVRLDHGGTGWVLPDDLDDVPEPEPWAVLLPVLDPTTMGWKERAFYLDPAHVPFLFDRNGNAGSTAWWDGRVVGCWVQDAEGVVRVVALDDVGEEAGRALADEADRLTEWLAGDVVATVYPSQLMRDHRS